MSIRDTLRSIVTFSPAELEPIRPDVLSATGPQDAYAIAANALPPLLFPVSIRAECADLIRSICHVLLMRAKEQMTRIAALRVISAGAVVADLQPVRDWADVQLPRNPMSPERPLFAVESLPQLPVSVGRKRSRPQPAGVIAAGSVNVPLESLLQRDWLQTPAAEADAFGGAESPRLGFGVTSEHNKRVAAVFARPRDLRPGPCRIAVASSAGREAGRRTELDAVPFRDKLGSAHGARSEGILRGHDRLRSVVPYPRLVAQRGGFPLPQIIPQEAAKWA